MITKSKTFLVSINDCKNPFSFILYERICICMKGYVCKNKDISHIYLYTYIYEKKQLTCILFHRYIGTLSHSIPKFTVLSFLLRECGKMIDVSGN